MPISSVLKFLGNAADMRRATLPECPARSRRSQILAPWCIHRGHIPPSPGLRTRFPPAQPPVASSPAHPWNPSGWTPTAHQGGSPPIPADRPHSGAIPHPLPTGAALMGHLLSRENKWLCRYSSPLHGWAGPPLAASTGNGRSRGSNRPQDEAAIPTVRSNPGLSCDWHHLTSVTANTRCLSFSGIASSPTMRTAT